MILRPRPRLLVLLALTLLALAPQAAPVHGQQAGLSLTVPVTFTVTSTADTHDATPGDGVCADSSNQCTLRAAIEEADAQPVGSSITITIPAGTYALPLGTLSLTRNTITLAGAGANATTLDGQGSRVLAVAVTAFAKIGGLTLTDGNAGSGSGGALANRGLAILRSSAVINNTATNGGGLYNAPTAQMLLLDSTVVSDTAPQGSGGGIVNQGTLQVSGSTLRGNTARVGGAIASTGTLPLTSSTLTTNTATLPCCAYLYGGGGLYTSGTASVISSTLRGNTAYDGGGGGLDNGDGGTLTVTNSTLSGNTAGTSGGGGGIYNEGRLTLTYATVAGNSSGLLNDTCCGNTLALSGTIVAGSTRGPNCSGPIAEAQGYNLDSGASCAFSQPTDLINTDPLLGPLQNNGGPTPTRALLSGSPAIDSGGTAAQGCPPLDQRGVARPDAGEARCDMGAFESQGVG